MTIRLTYFRVDGLFGEYTNEINININEHITAVIGPNGRGKTVCLRLINALYLRNFWYLTTIQFDKLSYAFSNGIRLEITRTNSDEEIDEEETSHLKQIPLVVRLVRENVLLTEWSPRQAPIGVPISVISRSIPWLTRVGPTIWQDDRTGERLNTEAVFSRYADTLPAEALGKSMAGEPEAMTEALHDFECHLIETQRLLNFSEDLRPQPYERGRRIEPSLVVQQKARKLHILFQRQLAEYGILSQKLDRSFPRRVLSNRSDKTLSLKELSQKLKVLEERRKSLESAGILDQEEESLFTIPENIDGPIGQMLLVYAEDNDAKLNHFSNLLAKIKLFSEIINDRFIAKHVIVDKSVGFKILSDKDREIPLDKLSSGEQHQLILVFELLFELSQNTLVMIDEPELSLHVSWQKKFIGDLKRIIDLNQVDIILATHSPQLIGRWNNLAVELAAVDE